MPRRETLRSFCGRTQGDKNPNVVLTLPEKGKNLKLRNCHCERSEAISTDHSICWDCFVAALLAMTLALAVDDFLSAVYNQGISSNLSLIHI